MENPSLYFNYDYDIVNITVIVLILVIALAGVVATAFPGLVRLALHLS